MTNTRPTEDGWYWLQECSDSGRWHEPTMVYVTVYKNKNRTTGSVRGRYGTIGRLQAIPDYNLWSERIVSDGMPVESIRLNHIAVVVCDKCLVATPKVDNGRGYLCSPTDWGYTSQMRLCPACFDDYERKRR